MGSATRVSNRSLWTRQFPTEGIFAGLRGLVGGGSPPLGKCCSDLGAGFLMSAYSLGSTGPTPCAEGRPTTVSPATGRRVDDGEAAKHGTGKPVAQNVQLLSLHTPWTTQKLCFGYMSFAETTHSKGAWEMVRLHTQGRLQFVRNKG